MDAIATHRQREDAEGFAALLQRHRGIVYKVAATYARGAEDREDLAQEIAAELWRAWPRYDPARSVSTWMYRVRHRAATAATAFAAASASSPTWTPSSAAERARRAQNSAASTITMPASDTPQTALRT